MANYNITRRNSANSGFYDLVNSLFNDEFAIATPLKNIIVDVQDLGDKYIVEADVPGIEKKDIDLTFEDDYLSISIKKETKTEEKDENTKYVRRERQFASENRVLYLKDATKNDIKAKLDEGVLTITIAKKTDAKDENTKITIE